LFGGLSGAAMGFIGSSVAGSGGEVATTGAGGIQVAATPATSTPDTMMPGIIVTGTRIPPSIPPPGLVPELLFNGQFLSLNSGDKILSQWRAYSGKDWCMNNPVCQRTRGGPLPEGRYLADPKRIERISLVDDILGRSNKGKWLGGAESWGPFRVELDIAPGTIIAPRTGGFYIHGGSIPGSAGCIDLCTWSKGFFDFLARQPAPVPLRVAY
jgi:hypothetical protein